MATCVDSLTAQVNLLMDHINENDEIYMSIAGYVIFVAIIFFVITHFLYSGRQANVIKLRVDGYNELDIASLERRPMIIASVAMYIEKFYFFILAFVLTYLIYLAFFVEESNCVKLFILLLIYSLVTIVLYCVLIEMCHFVTPQGKKMDRFDTQDVPSHPIYICHESKLFCIDYSRTTSDTDD